MRGAVPVWVSEDGGNEARGDSMAGVVIRMATLRQPDGLRVRN